MIYYSPFPAYGVNSQKTLNNAYIDFDCVLKRFCQEGEDTALLTLIQFMAAALMAWLLSLATETPPDALPAGAVAAQVVLLALGAALLAAGGSRRKAMR